MYQLGVDWPWLVNTGTELLWLSNNRARPVCDQTEFGDASGGARFAFWRYENCSSVAQSVFRILAKGPQRHTLDTRIFSFRGLTLLILE